MRISIIIPVYNVAAFMLNCIKAVHHQTYKDIEVIFVDDCGTDGSISLVKSYIKEHDITNWEIVSHKRNRGLSAARNTGLKAAKGEYVYFLDSDDTITNDCIEQLIQPIQHYRYDFIIGNYKAQPSFKEFPPLLLNNCSYKSNEDILHSYANGEWYMMAWNKLCNREFLMKNALFFEEGLNHEDVIWSFNLACKAESMHAIANETYIYTVRENSIMTGTSIDKDANTYAKAYIEMTTYAKREREYLADIYTLLEGRKSTFLYSLLHKSRTDLYNSYYSILRKHKYLHPFTAYRKGLITKKQLIRDLHYCLPTTIGKWYKHLLYHLTYSVGRRKLEGRLWD